MKTKIKFLGIMLLIVFLCNCRKDNTNRMDFKVMDSIPSNRYYSSDIMPDNHKNIYGNWNVTGTSGGITGGGYQIDFDYLSLKANGIFGVFRNDSLIAFGKIILTQNNGSLLCTFDFDKTANIDLRNDPEKFIQIINNDTLNLTAPCCDRYNIHLTRKQ